MGPQVAYGIHQDRPPAAIAPTLARPETPESWQEDRADAFTHRAPHPRPTLRLMPPGITGGNDATAAARGRR
jgi:hypothetical protein